MGMRHTIGWMLLAAPFVALAIYSVYVAGWKAAVCVWAIAIATVTAILIGAILVCM